MLEVPVEPLNIAKVSKSVQDPLRIQQADIQQV